MELQEIVVKLMQMRGELPEGYALAISLEPDGVFRAYLWYGQEILAMASTNFDTINSFFSLLDALVSGRTTLEKKTETKHKLVVNA